MSRSGLHPVHFSSVTHLVGPLVSDVNDMIQVIKFLTGIFTADIYKVSLDEAVNTMKDRYERALQEEFPDLSSAVFYVLTNLNPTTMCRMMWYYVNEGIFKDGPDQISAFYSYGSIYNWLMESAILPDVDPQGTVRRALGNHITQPFMPSYDLSFRQDFNAGNDDGWVPTTVREPAYPFIQLAYAGRHLYRDTEERTGSTQINKNEIFYVLREFVHMGHNAIQALINDVDDAAAHPRVNLELVYRTSAKIIYNLTMERITDPSSDLPLNAKFVLAKSQLGAACLYLASNAWLIVDAVRNRSTLEIMTFLMYKYIIETALCYDVDGQIRTVIEERFDPVWKIENADQYPHDFRPFGFEYELAELDAMWRSGMMDLPNDGEQEAGFQPTNAASSNRTRAGEPADIPMGGADDHPAEDTQEHEVMDEPIEAIGPRQNPLFVGTRVSAAILTEGDRCNICFDHLTDQSVCLQLQCGHIFDVECLDSLINAAYRSGIVPCPLCRGIICNARNFRPAPQ